MTTSGPLSTALTKLSAALDEAEAAAEARRKANTDVAAMAADSSELSAALADLRRDYANLKSVTDDVTHRLDGTIERVESILGGRT